MRSPGRWRDRLLARVSALTQHLLPESWSSREGAAGGRGLPQRGLRMVVPTARVTAHLPAPGPQRPLGAEPDTGSPAGPRPATPMHPSPPAVPFPPWPPPRLPGPLSLVFLLLLCPWEVLSEVTGALPSTPSSPLPGEHPFALAGHRPALLLPGRAASRLQGPFALNAWAPWCPLASSPWALGGTAQTQATTASGPSLLGPHKLPKERAPAAHPVPRSPGPMIPGVLTLLIGLASQTADSGIPRPT